MKEKYKILVNKVLWITIAWLFISLFLLANDYFVGLYYQNIASEEHTTASMLIGNLTAVLLAGLIGGTVVVTVMSNWLRTKPYGLALLYIFLSYSAIYFFVSITSGLIIHFPALESNPNKTEAVFNVLRHFLNANFVKMFIFWLIVVLGTNVVMLVNDKYGPGVFADFLLGRYFHPKKEERIFMFLDIRSSTSIAEKLGEEQYFEFLKDFFKDATPSIIYSKGEIYQYVGDEMVISWKTRKGKQNANCIKCFFDIKKAINEKAQYYLNEYGFIPHFKAGLHYGTVVAGEIGLVKRDIVFSGDVLNTASRIQNQCNQMKVDILVSKTLLDRISPAPNLYEFSKVGDILLRGKGQSIPLFTI